MGLVFVVLAIIFLGNKMVWEHSDIATLKSEGARNTSSQTITQVVNKPPEKPNIFGRKKMKAYIKMIPRTVCYKHHSLPTDF